MRDFAEIPDTPDLELIHGPAFTQSDQWMGRSGKASWDPQAGPVYDTPLTQFTFDDDGASLQPVHALATDSGEPQMALSRGGFGTLKRAGSP